MPAQTLAVKVGGGAGEGGGDGIGMGQGSTKFSAKFLWRTFLCQVSVVPAPGSSIRVHSPTCRPS